MWDMGMADDACNMKTTYYVVVNPTIPSIHMDDDRTSNYRSSSASASFSPVGCSGRAGPAETSHPPKNSRSEVSVMQLTDSQSYMDRSRKYVKFCMFLEKGVSAAISHEFPSVDQATARSPHLRIHDRDVVTVVVHTKCREHHSVIQGPAG